MQPKCNYGNTSDWDLWKDFKFIRSCSKSYLLSDVSIRFISVLFVGSILSCYPCSCHFDMCGCFNQSCIALRDGRPVLCSFLQLIVRRTCRWIDADCPAESHSSTVFRRSFGGIFFIAHELCIALPYVNSMTESPSVPHVFLVLA